MHLKVKATNLSYKINEKKLFQNISFALSSGRAIHIQGDNGSGKTTLIKLLQGELSPSTGKIKIGTNLNIAYFDNEHEDMQISYFNADAAAEKGAYAAEDSQDDEGSVKQDVFTTRLKLAEAYIEMGDEHGARDMLQEVIADGSAEQQDVARRIMARLDGGDD